MTKLWAVLLIVASCLLVAPVLWTLTTSAPAPVKMDFWLAEGGGGGACNRPSAPVDPETGKPTLDTKSQEPRNFFQVIGTAEGGGGGAG
jgi:hypothetical protein